jgi:hypothetical protein
MPTIPIRGLSAAGIIKDLQPGDIALSGWTGGTNVRFEDGKALSAPVMRPLALYGPGNPTSPAGIASFPPGAGQDLVFLMGTDGTVGQITPTASGSYPFTITDVTDTGFTPGVDSHQFTSCFLGGVLYINRETNAPRYWGSTSTKFAPIPNMDTPSWTCTILRAYRDFLVAFNVTKGANGYPTMVKWSDATLYGSPPGSWDPTLSTALAGENILSQSDGKIVDANNLGNTMIIYTPQQIWRMDYTGDKTFLFTFTKLWDDERWGALNRNCSVEVDGLHYVFGKADLYVHDGQSRPESVADSRVRRWVFSTMNASAYKTAFVAHNPDLHEVMFCYQSADADVMFPAYGANKAAVWNYVSKTWSFRELPCVTGWTVANGSVATTWGSSPSSATWGTVGGSWQDQSDGYKPVLMMPSSASGGAPLVSSQLMAVDLPMRGSRVNVAFDPIASTAGYLEHAGISMTEEGAPAQGFKVLRALMPMASLTAGGPFTIRIGAAPYFGNTPNYKTVATFTPINDYQVQSRASGRVVALRFEWPAGSDFDLAGFDIETVSGGKR